MTDKERLDEIKNTRHCLFSKEIDWLIEQVEQVAIWKDIGKTFEQATLNYAEENKKLRAALESIKTSADFGEGEPTRYFEEIWNLAHKALGGN